MKGIEAGTEIGVVADAVVVEIAIALHLTTHGLVHVPVVQED